MGPPNSGLLVGRGPYFRCLAKPIRKWRGPSFMAQPPSRKLKQTPNWRTPAYRANCDGKLFNDHCRKTRCYFQV